MLGGAKRDVHTAHVGAPAVVVSIVTKLDTHVGKAPIVFFFEGVDGTVRCGITRLPELLDKFVPLVIGLERKKLAMLSLSDKENSSLLPFY